MDQQAMTSVATDGPGVNNNNNNNNSSTSTANNSHRSSTPTTANHVSSELSYMHGRYTQDEYNSTVYGNYGQHAGYYGSATTGSGMYLNSPAMASFLYPHLYSAASVPGLQLHSSDQQVHQGGQGGGHAHLQGGGSLDEYILSDPLARGDVSGVTETGYSQLDTIPGTGGPEEGQTGPIRGAYAGGRAEHVWRPYWEKLFLEIPRLWWPIIIMNFIYR